MIAPEVLERFRQTSALLEGHFIYASGRHGRQFLQASRVLQHPPVTEELCKAMAAPFQEDDIALVVGPATGGIILAYECGRQLDCRAAFTEKEADGSMAMKRGFRLDPGTRTLVVEDITTTGGSVRKTIEHLRRRGAEIAGVACLIDRSGGEVSFDCRFEPLAGLHMETWSPEDCPLCNEKVAVMEPDDLIV